MAEIVLKNIVKIYPHIDKKKGDAPKKKKNLQITERGVVAVQQFNLDIKDKEFIVLVGPSGCGKSTTLRMVAGLEDITEGELYIDGKLCNAIEPKDRDIAMVFQSYALYPHMTIFENMAYPLSFVKVPITDANGNEVKDSKGNVKLRHLTKKEIADRVNEAANILNISDYLERKPKNLSGGQRQRVAIGRAIVRNPKALLMDEPLSNLDAKLRNEMRAEIIKLRKRINSTFIYVTHDQTEAITLGDRIVVMKDGFVQQVGTPQAVFDHPRNLFVSGFIGVPQMNYFDAKLIKNGDKYVVQVGNLTVDVSDEKNKRLLENNIDTQDITLGVRPDHIMVGDYPLKGTINIYELMGTSFHLHLDVDGNSAIVIAPNDGCQKFKGGDNIGITFNGNCVHMFSKQNEKNLEYLNEPSPIEYSVERPQ